MTLLLLFSHYLPQPRPLANNTSQARQLGRNCGRDIIDAIEQTFALDFAASLETGPIGIDEVVPLLPILSTAAIQCMTFLEDAKYILEDQSTANSTGSPLLLPDYMMEEHEKGERPTTGHASNAMGNPATTMSRGSSSSRRSTCPMHGMATRGTGSPSATRRDNVSESQGLPNNTWESEHTANVTEVNTMGAGTDTTNTPGGPAVLPHEESTNIVARATNTANEETTTPSPSKKKKKTTTKLVPDSHGIKRYMSDA